MKSDWCYYHLPFGVDLLGVDGSVGVGASQVHMIGLHYLGNLIVVGQNGQAFLVSFRQCSFELLVGCAQTLTYNTLNKKYIISQYNTKEHP